MTEEIRRGVNLVVSGLGYIILWAWRLYGTTLAKQCITLKLLLQTFGVVFMQLWMHIWMQQGQNHRNQNLFCDEWQTGSCGVPMFTTYFWKVMEASKISRKIIGTKLKLYHYIITGVIVITTASMEPIRKFYSSLSGCTNIISEEPLIILE